MRQETTEQRTSLLDRPVYASSKITWWSVLYIGVMLFVVATRLWALSSRAYCHDESIHAWEAWKLATGQGYTHNPIYHGPFLYHLTALIFALFGNSDFTARLATSVMGILIVVCRSCYVSRSAPRGRYWLVFSWPSRRC